MSRIQRPARALIVGSLPAILALLAPGTAAALQYTSKPGPFRSSPRFTVFYSGSGRFHTVYHSVPPNPGGKHDTNDASDSSTQRWAFRFRQQLTVASCTPPACTQPASVIGAVGSSSATGQIKHRHHDGLFKADNVQISCRVQAMTPPRRVVQASITASYAPGSTTVMLTASDPVADVLADLPSACPRQGDAFDGLANSYFAPGYSVSPLYGPDRWFSGAAAVPLAVLQRSSRITVPLANSAAGTPPRNCAVSRPQIERCRTGGSWRGTLVLQANG